MKYRNFKISLLYLLLIIISTSPLKTVEANQENFSLGLFTAGAITLGIGCWAIVQNIKKNSLANELDKLKKENYALKQVEGLLLDYQKIVTQLKHEYSSIFNLEDSPSKIIEHLIEQGLEKETLYKKISSDYNNLYDRYSRLQFILKKWETYPSFKKIASYATESLHEAENIYNNLSKIYQPLKNYRAFLLLHDFALFSLYSSYQKEYNLIISNSDYFPLLNKHILSLYSSSQYKFPYLSYLDQLNKVTKTAKSLLYQVNLEEKQDSYAPIIHLSWYKHEKNKIIEFITILENIIERIVISSEYSSEKAKKALFEKEEQLIVAQIKEKEARIKEEQKKNEILMLKERNKAQQLANEKKAKQLKEKQIMLELKKIQDGETIKHALKENNQKWQSLLDRADKNYAQNLKEALNSNESRWKNIIDNTKKENAKKIKQLQAELLTCKNTSSKIKYLENQLDACKKDKNKYYNQQEASKAKLKKATKVISDLSQKLDNPPFNPYIIDELPEYLKELKNINHSLNKAIS